MKTSFGRTRRREQSLENDWNEFGEVWKKIEKSLVDALGLNQVWKTGSHTTHRTNPRYAQSNPYKGHVRCKAASLSVQGIGL